MVFFKYFVNNLRQLTAERLIIPISNIILKYTNILKAAKKLSDSDKNRLLTEGRRSSRYSVASDAAASSVGLLSSFLFIRATTTKRPFSV